MQPTFLPRPQPLQAGLKPVAQSSKAGKRWWQGADGWAFPCHSHIRRTCVCSNSAFHSLSHRAHLLLHVGGGMLRPHTVGAMAAMLAQPLPIGCAQLVAAAAVTFGPGTGCCLGEQCSQTA